MAGVGKISKSMYKVYNFKHGYNLRTIRNLHFTSMVNSSSSAGKL